MNADKREKARKRESEGKEKKKKKKRQTDWAPRWHKKRQRGRKEEKQSFVFPSGTVRHSRFLRCVFRSRGWETYPMIGKTGSPALFMINVEVWRMMVDYTTLATIDTSGTAPYWFLSCLEKQFNSNPGMPLSSHLTLLAVHSECTWNHHIVSTTGPPKQTSTNHDTAWQSHQTLKRNCDVLLTFHHSFPRSTYSIRVHPYSYLYRTCTVSYPSPPDRYTY
ncbi:hypothetical protein L873DRAFT_250639 [Choiromyces venosus 120613-1]|uniref:Uncharacterized protein n=1 Tax=Choiromyces venosus 120613-1 TaxID=1336337 RepID=A0A3N4J438_9PEZI|nr:hypothetical protein L873DRAFT_250639 [Choiromyces venosus 120613-1]